MFPALELRYLMQPAECSLPLLVSSRINKSSALLSSKEWNNGFSSDSFVWISVTKSKVFFWSVRKLKNLQICAIDKSIWIKILIFLIQRGHFVFQKNIKVVIERSKKMTKMIWKLVSFWYATKMVPKSREFLSSEWMIVFLRSGWSWFGSCI